MLCSPFESDSIIAPNPGNAWNESVRFLVQYRQAGPAKPAALPGGLEAAVRPLPDIGTAVIHGDCQDSTLAAAPHFEEGLLGPLAGGDGVFQQVPDDDAQFAVRYAPGIPGKCPGGWRPPPLPAARWPGSAWRSRLQGDCCTACRRCPPKGRPAAYSNRKGPSHTPG